jgi:hypothetical protein
MDVQHHYQLLLHREMGQLINTARCYYREADRQVSQVDQLRALVTEKDGIIAARNETIHHREDQINESDAIITQRNRIIEFLQEQIHDLILEIDDAHAHINELQQQPAPPAVPAPEEEEDPEEESPRLILSMGILLLVPIILLWAVSHQWATLMTSSFGWVGDSLAVISVEKCDIGSV